ARIENVILIIKRIYQNNSNEKVNKKPKRGKSKLHTSSTAETSVRSQIDIIIYSSCYIVVQNLEIYYLFTDLVGGPITRKSKKEMLTVSCAGVNNNLACGDVVVHPTKKWPWLSRMSSQTTVLIRICDKCDNIVQVVPSGFGYNTFDRCQECNEDSNVKTYIALDSATILSAGSKSTDVLKVRHLDRGLKESKALLELKNDTYLESVSTYHLVNFTSYPKNGDSSPLDGTEKLVSACSARFSFVENNGVYRLDGSRNYGTIKNVRCSVDGFILPNSKFILTKVDNLRLRPTSVLQKLAHGSTVPIIYKHWLGQCYSFVARWYFRLDDGKEFYAENTDTQGFSDFLFKGVTGQSICQAFDLIPGEKVQINSALIQRAHWTEAGSMSDDLSQRLIVTPENVPSNAESDYRNTISRSSTSIQPKLDDKTTKILPVDKSTLSEMKETDEEVNCRSWSANAVQVEGIFLKFQVRKIMVSWLRKLAHDNRVDNNIDKTPLKTEIDEGEMKDILYLDIPNYSNMTDYEPFNRFIVNYDESIDKTNILTAEVWRKNLFSSETDSTNCVVDDNDIETEIQKGRATFFAPICSKTLVDVLWEDGTYETSISSDCLKPRMISGYPPTKEYYPAMYIFVPRKAKKRQ
uniref:Uncharacterized protein n=1 Tax=Romanomermis culicivorax TaxID=13658 RepID=A0A915K5A7_ROMCU